ncbi:MAG TPA: hypothetical protein VMV77_06815 [Bacteroidales bacterium]|nr:hypothetical protein [Bacteroidales bacterium]
MALINGRKFSKIIHRYRCDDNVLQQVREHILSNYWQSEQLEEGRCHVTLTDNSN